MTNPAIPPSGTTRHGAFRHRGFVLYLFARLCANFAVNIVSVAVGWQVYDLTQNPLDLGIIGLVQFLPALVLVLITGAVADRYNRRMIMALCMVGEALCALGLFLFTQTGSTNVIIVFGILLAFGVVRAFIGPAASSLVPNLVPAEDLGNAIAWNSSTWQIATICGPVLGGLLYGVAPAAPYALALTLLLVGVVMVSLIAKPIQKTLAEKASWEAAIAGFRYVWKEKIVLGAISLDLFAVLLGGATALMPVYARDVLEVGPWGLGLLRAAPAIGAIAVAAYLAFRPVKDHAGLVLFVFVTLFGTFTIIFGLSTSVWLSVTALVLMGASDMFSVYIRETLIQVWTPDAVRGRVNAVNMVFLGASNELGEFRAGVSAAMIGAVGAVVIGGAGTVAVAAIWSRLFPDLRRARHLDGRP
ncbi:MFS transporter [Kaistia dalseonensis]|uniref:MFS family permease n=1 Tax=Kaistia dalseonensis TaxID=410840 RepID=A0ABU0HBK0_9HYPH|nr:MFS transporter [Kaistia dalseonensis]MCX5497058.1 MFS transporter [Kaistia dalseonensis]MDQ0439684.1 MFS family permease [Kaistia dalseonensis]